MHPAYDHVDCAYLLCLDLQRNKDTKRDKVHILHLHGLVLPLL